MIKNLKKRILVILTACTLALCGGFAFIPPVTAYAVETAIVTVGNTYTFERDGAECEVMFLEDGNCTLYMDGSYRDGTYVASKSGKVYLSTSAEFIGSYEVSGNTLVSTDVGLTVPDKDMTESTETSENSAGNSEISSDSGANEETPVEPETPENGENTDGEIEKDKLTKEEVSGIIKEAFNKSKEWIINTYAWIIGISSGSVVTLLFSILWKLISNKITRSNTFTEEKVEKIVTKTVEKVVSKIVGKSLNVDIQAEVSNSVKEELAPMIRNMQVAMESAKNAEVGTAMVLKAQSKSRLISEEETAEMESRAASLLAHAEKFGGLSVPIQIQTKMKGEEPAPVKESVNLVETPNKPKEKKENESYISF